MKTLNAVVDALCKLVMGVSALVVFVITFAQVLCRFVFKSPLPWSQDVLRLAFTYMVYWGAAWCVKVKGHLNVDVLLTSLPEKGRRILELLINVVLCGLFIFMIIQGWHFAMLGLNQTTSYLPLPMTYYYLSIPTAAVIMLFYMVQIVVAQIRDLGAKEGGKA